MIDARADEFASFESFRGELNVVACSFSTTIVQAASVAAVAEAARLIVREPATATPRFVDLDGGSSGKAE